MNYLYCISQFCFCALLLGILSLAILYGAAAMELDPGFATRFVTCRFDGSLVPQFICEGALANFWEALLNLGFIFLAGPLETFMHMDQYILPFGLAPLVTAIIILGLIYPAFWWRRRTKQNT